MPKLYLLGSIPNANSEFGPLPPALEEQLDPDEQLPSSNLKIFEFLLCTASFGKDVGPEVVPNGPVFVPNADLDPKGPKAKPLLVVPVFTWLCPNPLLLSIFKLARRPSFPICPEFLLHFPQTFLELWKAILSLRELIVIRRGTDLLLPQ